MKTPMMLLRKRHLGPHSPCLKGQGGNAPVLRRPCLPWLRSRRSKGQRFLGRVGVGFL